MQLRVKELREEKGWNQTVLGYHAGLSPSQISQIENGKRNPTLETLQGIATALGVEVGDLFPKASAPPESELAGQSEGWAESYAEYGEREVARWEAQAPKQASRAEKFGVYLRPNSIFGRVGRDAYFQWASSIVESALDYVQLAHDRREYLDRIQKVSIRMLRVARQSNDRAREIAMAAQHDEHPDFSKFRDQLGDPNELEALVKQYREMVAAQESR